MGQEAHKQDTVQGQGQNSNSHDSGYFWREVGISGIRHDLAAVTGQSQQDEMGTTTSGGAGSLHWSEEDKAHTCRVHGATSTMIHPALAFQL